MTDNTKRRGRPKGTEKDDSQIMQQVADLLAASPKLRPTTAMKRIKPKASDAELRRWQVKWRSRAAGFLASAQARVEKAKVRSLPRYGATSGSAAGRSRVTSAVERIMEEERRAVAFMNPPELKGLRALSEDAATRMMMKLLDDPVTKLMRQIENDPVTRLMREHERMEKMLGLDRLDRFGKGLF